MVALDLRIDAVMKIRGRSLVCAFFTTDDGVYCVRRTSDGRKKSKILNHDKMSSLVQSSSSGAYPSVLALHGANSVC